MVPRMRPERGWSSRRAPACDSITTRSLPRPRSGPCPWCFVPHVDLFETEPLAGQLRELPQGPPSLPSSADLRALTCSAVAPAVDVHELLRAPLELVPADWKTSSQVTPPTSTPPIFALLMWPRGSRAGSVLGFLTEMQDRSKRSRTLRPPGPRVGSRWMPWGPPPGAPLRCRRASLGRAGSARQRADLRRSRLRSGRSGIL